MDLAVQILQIVFYSIGSLFMIIFSIIGIWSFIVFNKYYKTKKNENYLLEKIYNSINKLAYKNNNSLNNNSDDSLIKTDDLLKAKD